MKYWEIIINKIVKAGFSVGWVSALDVYGRTVWIVDAYRDGQRFIVRADEILTAFLELESAISRRAELERAAIFRAYQPDQTRADCAALDFEILNGRAQTRSARICLFMRPAKIYASIRIY